MMEFGRPIELKRKDLRIYKEKIHFKENESKRNYEIEKKRREQESKDCTWITRWYVNICINRLETRIRELDELETIEEEIEKLENQRRDNTPGEVWDGYPCCLDKKIVIDYTSKFKTLSYPLTPNVPYINIIMIGETGAGKSSFLNTFATALSDGTDIQQIYRVSPSQSREQSATKKMHLEPIYIGSTGNQVPCNFYDVPGLVNRETRMEKNFDMIIQGKLIIDDEMNKTPKTRNPTPADQIHCILYVIKADSDLFSQTSKRIRNIIKRQFSEDGVRQFVIVTAADKIVIPGAKMKDIYRFSCLRKFCEKVSQEFGIALDNVIPVSNYCKEGAANDAKNAMSLYCLWRVFKAGKDYIERHWNRRETFKDFKRI